MWAQFLANRQLRLGSEEQQVTWRGLIGLYLQALDIYSSTSASINMQQEEGLTSALSEPLDITSAMLDSLLVFPTHKSTPVRNNNDTNYGRMMERIYRTLWASAEGVH